MRKTTICQNYTVKFGKILMICSLVVSIWVNHQGQCNRTKMRIVGKEKWERKAYIEKGNSVLIQKIISIRLNMGNQKRNYRNKYWDMISYVLCVMRRRIRLSMYSLVKMPSHPELGQNDSHNSRDTGLRIKMCELYECNEKLCNEVKSTDRTVKSVVGLEVVQDSRNNRSSKCIRSPRCC